MVRKTVNRIPRGGWVSGGRAGGRFNINNFKDSNGKLDYNRMERFLRLVAVGALGAAGAGNLPPEDIPLDVVKKVYEMMRPDESIKIKGSSTRVGMMDHNANGGVNAGESEVPFRMTESVKRKLGSAAGYTSKIYRTSLEQGRKNTSAVRQYSRLNGYEQNKWIDTQFTTKYNTGIERANLGLATGFNQKEAAVFNEAHVTAKDIVDLFNFTSWNPSSNKLERVYGFMRNFYSRYMIMNTGSYFPSRVSIKIYRQTSGLRTPATAIQSAFPTNTELLNNLQGDHMPLKYVYTGFTSTATSAIGRYDIKASLDNSPEFDRQYRHVKTFRQTLQPGDIWDFSYKVHCGPGLRLDRIREIYDENNNAAVGDIVVIEHHGVMCEAVRQSSLSESIIGTSPSWLQVRFEKGHESVRAPQTQPGSLSGTGEGGVDTTKYLIRSFQQKDGDDALTVKRLNFGVDKIGDKNQTGTDVFIPVLTDKLIDYAQARGDADDNQDIGATAINEPTPVDPPVVDPLPVEE